MTRSRSLPRRCRRRTRSPVEPGGRGRSLRSSKAGCWRRRQAGDQGSSAGGDRLGRLGLGGFYREASLGRGVDGGDGCARRASSRALLGGELLLGGRRPYHAHLLQQLALPIAARARPADGAIARPAGACVLPISLSIRRRSPRTLPRTPLPRSLTSQPCTNPLASSPADSHPPPLFTSTGQLAQPLLSPHPALQTGGRPPRPPAPFARRQPPAQSQLPLRERRRTNRPSIEPSPSLGQPASRQPSPPSVRPPRTATPSPISSSRQPSSRSLSPGFQRSSLAARPARPETPARPPRPHQAAAPPFRFPPSLASPPP